MAVTSTRSLVSRLVRSAVLWALPLLAVVALALTWLYRAQTYRFFDAPLESTVTALIATAEFKDGALQLSREPTDDDYQRALSGRYWLIGDLQPDGKILPFLTSRSLYEATLSLPPGESLELLADTGAEVRTSTTGPDGDEPLRVVARTVILPDMPDAVVIAAAADVREAARDVREFGAISIALIALLAAGLIMAVFVQVRLGLKPLFEMGARVADIREGRTMRVAGEYPKEIQPLASELNSLIDHNKSVVERARTHVGNLAHALKTPLAVLRNEAESGELSAEVVSRQTEEMNRQVEHHLRRAQAAARGQVVGVASDADEALDGLVRTLRRIHGRDGKTIDAHFPDDLVFRGEKRDLEEMVGNLLDNACKWATERVEVRAEVRGTALHIEISDDGPGIPEADRARAMKRGIRLDEDVPGTGLGLSIVDDLAGAYGGTLSLDESEAGGLLSTLVLPGRRDA